MAEALSRRYPSEGGYAGLSNRRLAQVTTPPHNRETCPALGANTADLP